MSQTPESKTETDVQGYGFINIGNVVFFSRGVVVKSFVAFEFFLQRRFVCQIATQPDSERRTAENWFKLLPDNYRRCSGETLCVSDLSTCLTG